MSKTTLFSQKRFLASLIFIFFLVIISLSAMAQPDEILLNNDKVFHGKKKPAVMFPHESHMSEFECLECHHQMRNGKNVLDPDDLEEDKAGVRCQDCHAGKTPGFSSDLDPSRRGLMQAYHKQCISCHRTGNGPRTCASCHKK